MKHSLLSVALLPLALMACNGRLDVLSSDGHNLDAAGTAGTTTQGGTAGKGGSSGRTSTAGTSGLGGGGDAGPSGAGGVLGFAGTGGTAGAGSTCVASDNDGGWNHFVYPEIPGCTPSLQVSDVCVDKSSEYFYLGYECEGGPPTVPQCEILPAEGVLCCGVIGFENRSDYFPDVRCGVEEIDDNQHPYIQPSFLEEPVGVGTGGTITQGTYYLESMVTHAGFDLSPCFLRYCSDQLTQRLELGQGEGTLYDVDTSLFECAVRFNYTTTGNEFSREVTCNSSPVATAFGPFSTYTSDGSRLTLYSPQCKYEMTYRLESP